MLSCWPISRYAFPKLVASTAGTQKTEQSGCASPMRKAASSAICVLHQGPPGQSPAALPAQFRLNTPQQQPQPYSHPQQFVPPPPPPPPPQPPVPAQPSPQAYYPPGSGTWTAQHPSSPSPAPVPTPSSASTFPQLQKSPPLYQPPSGYPQYPHAQQQQQHPQRAGPVPGTVITQPYPVQEKMQIQMQTQTHQWHSPNMNMTTDGCIQMRDSRPNTTTADGAGVGTGKSQGEQGVGAFRTIAGGCCKDASG